MKFFVIKREAHPSFTRAQANVFMALAAQAVHRTRIVDNKTTTGWWIHHPRLFFNPYFDDKVWSKTECRILDELEDKDIFSVHKGGWFLLTEQSWWALTNKLKPFSPDEYVSVETSDIMNLLK